MAEPETVTVTTSICIRCGNSGTVTLPREAYERLLAGQSIQTAWPEGSAGEREQLINGTHDACFEAMFPEEQD